MGEQNSGVKYRGVLLLALLVTVSVQTSAQDNPFMNGGQLLEKFRSLEGPQGLCPDYKIGIITPNVGTDFKMRLVIPPKHIDDGIVLTLCGTPQQLSFAPQLVPNLGPSSWSTGTVFMAGKGNVFMTGQGNVFTPRRIK